MRMLMLVLTATLGLAASAAGAAADCCGGDACCATAVCCQHGGAAAVQAPEPAPVREYAKVTFHSPVRVGDRVLMGTYVIEHDAERMASGGPCTHIYRIDDRRLPVVAFHCVHLDRPANDGSKATVTLRRVYDQATPLFELVEFQFAGSADGHGVPDAR